MRDQFQQDVLALDTQQADSDVFIGSEEVSRFDDSYIEMQLRRVAEMGGGKDSLAYHAAECIARLRECGQ